MRRPTIAIIGCGFIGSHLADEICKLCYSQDIFPFNILFVDFDTWEDRNAANQNVTYRIAVSGEAKAVTCANIANQYPNNTGIAVVDRLTASNGAEFLKDAVLVIDAVDNIPTRQLLWGLAISGASAPTMHIGISRKGDGMINWSSTSFDTFPFSPASVAGRDLQEQDIKEPPCEMYKYRASGTLLFQAAAKAIAIFFGKDPWNILQCDGDIERGTMTCWTTNVEVGEKLLVDYQYIDQNKGFFPNEWKDVDFYAINEEGA